MLGVDAKQNEYWVFKDDVSRVFIKGQASAPVSSSKQEPVEQ